MPETSNDGNYNLEDTLAQIKAIMAAGFASLQHDITTLRLQVTALTKANQAQAIKIQSLANTIQYLATQTHAQCLTPPPTNSAN